MSLDSGSYKLIIKSTTTFSGIKLLPILRTLTSFNNRIFLNVYFRISIYRGVSDTAAGNSILKGKKATISRIKVPFMM